MILNLIIRFDKKKTNKQIKKKRLNKDYLTFDFV